MLAGLLLGAGLITFAVLLAASEPTVVASSLGVARLRIASRWPWLSLSGIGQSRRVRRQTQTPDSRNPSEKRVRRLAAAASRLRPLRPARGQSALDRIEERSFRARIFAVMPGLFAPSR